MAEHQRGSDGSSEATEPDVSDAAEDAKSRRRSQTLVGGKFALGDDLGRGSSGRVFKALNAETGDFAAIKEISLTGISEARLHSIETEINMLRRLSHPRIVQYYECITDANRLYIVLEYVENGSLSDILRKFGRLPEQLVIRYIGQVLEALEFLHARAIIHRDIKGANVLVTKDGHVKLADFGVARLADEHVSSTQSVVGTPYWMAPEIIEMSAFATASDIWSVGCTVLELLTGVPPHFELTQMSAMYHIVNDDHPPLPDGLSDELRTFLMRCFVKDVHARATASELRAHAWLTSSSRSHLALSKDVSDSLPEFMTHTVDHETSWVSSEGVPAAAHDDSPAAEELRRRLWPLGQPRTPRQRVVSSADRQRRLAAAAGQGLALPEGAPSTDEPAPQLGTDAGRVGAGSPFNAETDPPLCGFLWKRGTSALGKLAYYKRYFYLKSGALCYCSGRTDSTIQQSLEKKIPLTSISSIGVSSDARFEFHMRCDSRLYQFRSRTLREMQVWVDTLKEEQLKHQGIFAVATPPAPARRPAHAPGALGAADRHARVAGASEGEPAERPRSGGRGVAAPSAAAPQHGSRSGTPNASRPTPQPQGSRSGTPSASRPTPQPHGGGAAAAGPRIGILRPVLTR